MTFNIRVNVASDSANAWPYRKDLAPSMIRFHHADIVGLQEALYGQVIDLQERLPNYSWFGVGRDDGEKAGEFMAIFYLKKRFRVVNHSTFWLSENPDTPGKGWDAACNRVVTWGKFKDIKTGKNFYLFNTHFDHMGETARRQSAKLLLEKIKTISGKPNIIVTGDFNASPHSVPYRTITQTPEEISDYRLTDTRTISLNPHHGPKGTFTGFKISAHLQQNQPIDYIFVSDGIKVLNHGTLSDTFDGRFPSDHFPVLAEMVIN
ncbi:endonuclease/exonuclease/phosphatase family protein [candidate division KSB1 bacterium]|nr:endonuclease/exonuclease/phosphatase family protein [candidate division KSB1 bacterium]